jgi:hypothetical protein
MQNDAALGAIAAMSAGSTASAVSILASAMLGFGLSISLRLGCRQTSFLRAAKMRPASAANNSRVCAFSPVLFVLVPRAPKLADQERENRRL